MLDKIIKFSLHNRLLILVCAVVALAAVAASVLAGMGAALRKIRH